MADSVPPQDLYAKHLRQSFGYPLWSPEPKPSLPSSYAESGLHIGDVGYVNRLGMFEVLFNICLPLDHELHKTRRKDLAGLVGLAEFDPNEVPPVPTIPAGRAISHGVEGPQGGVLRRTQGAPCTFKSKSPSGAILILPSGTACQYLGDSQEDEFRKLAMEHALEWSQFANRDSLYLITGFHKTDSWYLASFQDIKPTGQTVLQRDTNGIYDCDCRCDFRSCPEDNICQNQTVFISGFKIEVKKWDEHVQARVERLQSHPRNVWIESMWQAGFLFSVLISYCWKMASRFMSWIRGPRNDKGTIVHISQVPALSQPFHPSDVINRFLLDKNPHARVAITHDREWLRMLEENELFPADMSEPRFGVFLEENYTGMPASSNDVVFLRRNIQETQRRVSYNVHRPEVPLEAFSVPCVPDNMRQFAITRMRAENLVACLRRIPVGFYVVVQFDGTKKRSKCQPPSIYNSFIEWDDEIMLPANPTMNVQFSVIASFEFEPMLGNGELLCELEMKAGDLVDEGCTYCSVGRSEGGEYTSVCISLLVTFEERRFDYLMPLDRCDDILGFETGLTEASTKTDEGHYALFQYHRGEGTEKLGESIQCFEIALDSCPPNHECYASALFNLATARFIDCLAYNTANGLDTVITSYREALWFRPARHPDRPLTLLHLVQALLCGLRNSLEKPHVADEIEALATEVKQISSASSYYQLAAGLALQMFKQYWVQTPSKLPELNEFVWEIDRSARLLPDWYFDRPYRLIGLDDALGTRYEMTDSPDDLEKSILVMEEALRLISDTHFDRTWILLRLSELLFAQSLRYDEVVSFDNATCLLEDALRLSPKGGFLDRTWQLAPLRDAPHVQFVQRNDAGKPKMSMPTLFDAIMFAPDGYIDRLWVLSSLGDFFRVRFARGGDIFDLEASIFAMNSALKFAPDEYSEKPWLLAPLGFALYARFEQYNDIADLERSLSILEDVVNLEPDSYLRKAETFAFLGNALRIRFVLQGGISDLARSISTLEDAVKLAAENDPSKPWMLSSLGEALRVHFVRFGDIADLERSVSILEDAAEHIPNDAFEEPRILAYLGNVLCIRFDQCGNTADLERSISIMEDAAKLSHKSNPEIPAFFGDALRVYFVRNGDTADLERSISIMDSALEDTRNGYFEKPRMLASLGKALYLRFEQYGDIAGLERSITVIEDAVGRVADGHLEKPQILASLGNALRTRFLQLGNIADFEESILMMKQAARLAPDGYLGKPRMLAALVDALGVRSVLRSQSRSAKMPEKIKD